MQNKDRTLASLLLFTIACGAGMAARADTLLSAAHQSQLETWLGEGDLAFNAVYTKQAGDTSLDFHAAADGKGRTVSVMEASDGSGQSWLIGGYNPQSWSSNGQFNMTANNSDRTAFLFNLTSGTLYRQSLAGYAGDVGAHQTYNAADYGPTFGIGHDLYVPANLSTGGYSSLYSYTDPLVYQFGLSVVDGAPYQGPNVSFGAMQVFTISPVPEPAGYAMLLGGLALLGAALRGRTARRARVV